MRRQEENSKPVTEQPPRNQPTRLGGNQDTRAYSYSDDDFVQDDNGSDFGYSDDEFERIA